MENGPFIDDFPSYKPPFILGNFHGYVSHNQRVEPTVQTQVFICASQKIVSNPLKSVTKLPHQVLAIEPKHPTAQLPGMWLISP
jgi:hypothetical protein